MGEVQKFDDRDLSFFHSGFCALSSAQELLVNEKAIGRVLKQAEFKHPKGGFVRGKLPRTTLKYNSHPPHFSCPGLSC